MIIDSHCHLGGPDKGDGASQSPDGIIEIMDSSDIDKAVVFPFNEVNPGISFSKANDFIADAVGKYPDRLIGFARLDPNAGMGALLEFDRCVWDLGLKGIKLHPKAQNFTPSNVYVLRILEKASELDVPVVFDNGKEIFDNNSIGMLAKKVPDCKIIMAHMRGFGFIEVPERNANVYLGTVKASIERVSRAIEVLGSNKIIAGSDTPYTDMKFEMKEKFDNVKGLTERERKMICGLNIQKLLSM
jgi:predicted TIM-barrel fold metal-dependent hydrolase